MSENCGVDHHHICHLTVLLFQIMGYFKMIVLLIWYLLVMLDDCCADELANSGSTNIFNGKVYFYAPMSASGFESDTLEPSCRGGLAALYYFHHSLLELGVDSYFFSMNSNCYKSHYKHRHLNKWEPKTFTERDIIIIPEVLATRYLFGDIIDDLLTEWQDVSGARVVVWALAAMQTLPPEYVQPVPVDVEDLTHKRIIIVPNSEYIRKYHQLPVSGIVSKCSGIVHSCDKLSSGGVIRSPLSPDYELDRFIARCSAKNGIDAGNFVLDLYKECLHGASFNKTNLVLVDGDVPGAYEILSNSKIIWGPGAGSGAGIELVMLDGSYNAEQMQDLYRRAKVVLDLYVPGFERVLQEAALYGVVPLLAAKYNGATGDDFIFLDDKESLYVASSANNLQKYLRVDPNSGQDIANKIQYALNNYDALVKNPKLVEFREFVLGLSRSVPLDVSSLFHSASIGILVVSCSDVEDQLLFGMIISLIRSYPLISVEVRIRDLSHFRIEYVSMLRLLSRYGYTDTFGGQLYHSIRFREFNSNWDGVSSRDESLHPLCRHRNAYNDKRSALSSVQLLELEEILVAFGEPGIMHGDNVLYVHGADFLFSSPSNVLSEIISGHKRYIEGAEGLVVEASSVLSCYGMVDTGATFCILPTQWEHPVLIHGHPSVLHLQSVGNISRQLKSILLPSDAEVDYFKLIANDSGDGVHPSQFLHCYSRYFTWNERFDEISSLGVLSSDLRLNPLWMHYEHKVLGGRSGSSSNFMPSGEVICDTYDRLNPASVETGQPIDSFLPFPLVMLYDMLLGFASLGEGAGSKGEACSDAVELDIELHQRRFYYIKSTDTLVPFSYLFPAGDKDSAGEVLHPHLNAGAPQASEVSVDRKFPLYNGGVLEPGLSRLWYEILVYRSGPAHTDGGKRVVIDVGGNFGYYALLGASCNRLGVNSASSASTLFNPIEVLTFEPVLNFSNVLKANLVLNGLDRHVVVADMAVSNVDGLDMVIKVPYGGTLGTARFEDFEFDIAEDLNNELHYKIHTRTTTIDSYVQQHYVNGNAESSVEIPLLKIDVEGYEFYVIEGSQWVIERYRPHILMELQPKHLVAGVDADANRIGREYIQKWFDFLRKDMNYRVYYVAWEQIKYPPQYDRTMFSSSCYDWKELLPDYTEITGISIEQVLDIRITINFWFEPQPQ